MANSWLSSDRYRLYLIALGSILVGFVLIVIRLLMDGIDGWWQKALSEVGIAAVIAGFLIAGTERYLKESLFSEIETKISETLDSFRVTAFDLQRFSNLPQALQDRLRERILGAPVIQRDVTYRYELEKTEIDGDRAYRASVHMFSTYVNITPEQQRFTVKETLPAFTFEETKIDYGFSTIEGVLNGNGDFPTKLVPQVIKTHISSREGGPTVFSREALLDAGSELKVDFRATAYLHEEDWISLEAFLPTINMICETVGEDLTFTGQPSDSLSDIWEMNLGEAGENRWELAGAILPGQGFDLWFQD